MRASLSSRRRDRFCFVTLMPCDGWKKINTSPQFTGTKWDDLLLALDFTGAAALRFAFGAGDAAHMLAPSPSERNEDGICCQPQMPLASITRLRVRSIRYMPEFLFRALAIVRQARRSDGCLGADIRREVQLTFWTRTLWRDEQSMRAFMTTGAH